MGKSVHFWNRGFFKNIQQQIMETEVKNIYPFFDSHWSTDICHQNLNAVVRNSLDWCFLTSLTSGIEILVGVHGRKLQLVCRTCYSLLQSGSCWKSINLPDMRSYVQYIDQSVHQKCTNTTIKIVRPYVGGRNLQNHAVISWVQQHNQLAPAVWLARILARYQVCHVTYKHEISSINL